MDLDLAILDPAREAGRPFSSIAVPFVNPVGRTVWIAIAQFVNLKFYVSGRVVELIVGIRRRPEVSIAVQGGKIIRAVIR